MAVAAVTAVRGWIRGLYDWTLRLAAGPGAPKALAAVSFAESSFFPIPPDVMLIPMVIADRARAWRFAAICTAASVLGGLLGYAIGLLFYDSVGVWLIDLYGYSEKFVDVQATYAEWGGWLVLIAGFTPIPFKLVTLTSGFVGFDVLSFVLLALLSRGARFFLLAGLLYAFGPPIRAFIERRLELLAVVGTALLIGGFVVVRYLA